MPGINEISGESGSGKTQIALQLCLTVQLGVEYGGLQGGSSFVIYIILIPSNYFR